MRSGGGVAEGADSNSGILELLLILAALILTSGALIATALYGYGIDGCPNCVACEFAMASLPCLWLYAVRIRFREKVREDGRNNRS
jgi:hypothetical protein